MKTVRIIESCLVNRQHAESGTVIKDLPDHVAADLVVNGRAVFAKESRTIVTRDPEIEQRDPVTTPPRRGRPPKEQ